jgi:serine/threonine-protein kinase
MVLDFGMAKLLPRFGPHSELTGTGIVLGTPRYMAPEQIFGDPDVDARADVWAMGLLVFRMLAGRGALGGEAVGDVIRELRRGRVEELASIAPVPEGILDVVRRSTVVPRDGRLENIAAFVSAFAPYYRGEAGHPRI